MSWCQKCPRCESLICPAEDDCMHHDADDRCQCDFGELLAIIDRHAGKVHRIDGPVAEALYEVLDRHAEMIKTKRGKEGQ